MGNIPVSQAISFYSVRLSFTAGDVSGEMDLSLEHYMLRNLCIPGDERYRRCRSGFFRKKRFRARVADGNDSAIVSKITQECSGSLRCERANLDFFFFFPTGVQF